MGMDTAIREAVKEGFKEAVEELKTALAALPAAPNRTAPEALVDVEEAARRLGLAVSTVYQRAAALRLPSVKDGNRLLFRPADLDAYVAKRRRSFSLAQRLARGEKTPRASELSPSKSVRRRGDHARSNAEGDASPENEMARHPARRR